MEQKNVIMIVLTTMLSASVTGIILLCCKLVCMERLYEDLNRENAVLNHELRMADIRAMGKKPTGLFKKFGNIDIKIPGNRNKFRSIDICQVML